MFVFLVLEHQRRRVLYFGVTEHPTAEWTAQQVVEAFNEQGAKRYLVRDRDATYGNEFPRRIKSLGMKEVISAPRSPWQNAFAERMISGCFSQADLEVEGKGPLVIRECVRSIDGELLLESIAGRGSRLVITIPRKWQSGLWILKDRLRSIRRSATLMSSTKQSKLEN